MAKGTIKEYGPDDPIYQNSNWVISPVLRGKPLKQSTDLSSEPTQEPPMVPPGLTAGEQPTGAQPPLQPQSPLPNPGSSTS